MKRSGVWIIELCDKWSKQNQEKQRRETADQLKTYEDRIDELAQKCHSNNVRILVLEEELKQLKFTKSEKK